MEQSHSYQVRGPPRNTNRSFRRQNELRHSPKVPACVQFLFHIHKKLEYTHRFPQARTNQYSDRCGRYPSGGGLATRSAGQSAIRSVVQPASHPLSDPDSRAARQSDNQTGREPDSHPLREPESQTDRQPDRQTDRHTDREPSSQTTRLTAGQGDG